MYKNHYDNNKNDILLKNYLMTMKNEIDKYGKCYKYNKCYKNNKFNENNNENNIKNDELLEKVNISGVKESLIHFCYGHIWLIQKKYDPLLNMVYVNSFDEWSEYIKNVEPFGGWWCCYPSGFTNSNIKCIHCNDAIISI
jgi:hypothetical protein